MSIEKLITSITLNRDNNNSKDLDIAVLSKVFGLPEASNAVFGLNGSGVGFFTDNVIYGGLIPEKTDLRFFIENIGDSNVDVAGAATFLLAQNTVLANY